MGEPAMRHRRDRVEMPPVRRSRPPAGRVADVIRMAWGMFFLGSAAFNALVTAPEAGTVYVAFADLSWPPAGPLVRDLIVPVGTAFTYLVAAFEVVVGLLILNRRTARLGILISLGWLVVLIPFLGHYGLANVVLIAALVPLLKRDFHPTTPAHHRGEVDR
jgi:hypothetical protein